MKKDGYLTDGGRIAWAQALKGLGIYAIVLGHFGELAGDFYHIAFCFHVQLFFFAAGLFASRSNELGVREYLLKKARSLGAPYLFFSAANLVFFALYEGDGAGEVAEKLRQIALGVRNGIFCANLWFLPALFFAGLAYYFIKKAISNKYAALALCFAVSAAFRIFKEEPGWIFGVDQGLRFTFWFALGDCAFEPLDAISRAGIKALKPAARLAAVLGAIASCGILAAIWPGVKWVPERLGVNLTPTVEKGWRFVIALALIYLCALLAFKLSRLSALTRLGSRTLTVCCTEQAVRVTLIQAVTLFDLAIKITNQIQTLLYSALVVFICSHLIAAFLERYFPAALGRRALNN